MAQICRCKWQSCANAQRITDDMHDFSYKCLYTNGLSSVILDTSSYGEEEETAPDLQR